VPELRDERVGERLSDWRRDLPMVQCRVERAPRRHLDVAINTMHEL